MPAWRSSERCGKVRAARTVRFAGRGLQREAQAFDHERNAHSPPRLPRLSPSSFRGHARPRVRARRPSLCAARHLLRADRARGGPDRPEAGPRAAQAVGRLGPRWQGRCGLSGASRPWRCDALRVAVATRSSPRRARRHLLTGLARRRRGERGSQHRGTHWEMGSAPRRSEALARRGEGRRQARRRAPPRRRSERRPAPRRPRGFWVVRLGLAAGVSARTRGDGIDHVDSAGSRRPMAEP
jgi:hypothetical protein